MTKKNVDDGKLVIELEASVPQDYRITYWYENGQEMPECEQEHVVEMLEEGYTSGQLVYHDEKDNMVTGWWEVVRGDE